MRMRAAVLEEFGQPLVVQELELAEPRKGEVLVRLVACGVCHTDMYTASGVDPSGYAPAVLGHEGAGVVERVGEGVDARSRSATTSSRSSRRSAASACTASARKTNICLAIREQQNKGHLPDGTTRLSRDGEPIRHFMGTSTFAEYTVMPEIALAKVDPEAPLERAALFACGLSTGLGAAMYTAKVEAGLDVRRVRRRDGRPRRGRRLPPAGRRADRLRRPVARSAWRWRATRARPTRWSAGEDAVQQILEMTGGFGADYTFEATGIVRVMRQAVESARMGWGLCTIAGVAGKGETLDVIPRWLITGPPRRRLVVRRREGPRPGPAARRALPRRRHRRRRRSSRTASRSTRSTAASS